MHRNLALTALALTVTSDAAYAFCGDWHHSIAFSLEFAWATSGAKLPILGAIAVAFMAAGALVIRNALKAQPVADT